MTEKPVILLWIICGNPMDIVRKRTPFPQKRETGGVSHGRLGGSPRETLQNKYVLKPLREINTRAGRGVVFFFSFQTQNLQTAGGAA